MKKLKQFYKNNRVYCVLMIISIICVLAMGISIVAYFFGQTSSSPYGNRLEDISEYKITEELKKFEDFYKESKIVNSVKARVQGKIIILNADIKKESKEQDIQNLATSSIKSFTEEQLSFYDIQFIFTREDKVPYLGSKSANNTLLSWANYNVEVDKSTTTTTKKAKK